MKATIDVLNRAEATAIRRGLDDPIIRAIVLRLVDLPPAAHGRALMFVLTAVEDPPAAPAGNGTHPLRLHDGTTNSSGE
jgi:hypothetical protein